MKLPLALSVAALLALAPAARAEALRVRLLSPEPGAELPAGGTVGLAWDFAFAAPAGATEWEVFLSLDDGRTYPVRLTPHLDLDRRRVTVRLPETPSSTARFLLRVGDEREEVGAELGGTFSLVASAFPALFSPAEWTRVRGEAARPGLPGVTRWIEGARDGSSWREVAARPEPALRTTFTPGALELGATIPPRRPVDPPLVDTRLTAGTSVVPRPRLLIPIPPEPGVALLLLLRRANR